MGPIGVPEMVAIFVIALLLFGPKKLPELGRTLGKGITEFRRASNELKSTFESHLGDLEKEVQLEKKPNYSSPASSAVTYPYPHDDYGQYTPDYGSASHEATNPEMPVEQSALPPATPHDREVRADYYSSEHPVYSGSGRHPKTSESAEPDGPPSTTEASHSA